MTDKIEKLIEQLKLCDTHAEQYDLIQVFSIGAFFAGMNSVEKKKNPISILHLALNMMKRKKE